MMNLFLIVKEKHLPTIMNSHLDSNFKYWKSLIRLLAIMLVKPRSMNEY